MVKIKSRCFIVEIDGIQYVVKYGKIDEFLCLFLPSVVIISSMITSPGIVTGKQIGRAHV